MIVVISFISCDKDDDETKPKNEFIGTSWTATDDIAEAIYGGTCTTTIEFINETECQEIEIRESDASIPGTDVEQGTYTYDGNEVVWTVDDITITGTATGNVLETNMGTISGGNRVYIKD